MGRVRLSGVTVEVNAKVEGALEALLAFATGDSFRIERIPAPATRLGRTFSLLAASFLSAVSRYVGRGREFRYVRRSGRGTLVGGRLDITKTVHLRARGLGHLLAFERDEIARNTPKNNLIRAALLDLERLSRVVPIGDDALATARGLAALFQDCTDAEVLFGRRDALVRRAELFRSTAPSDDEKDLFALVSVMLSRVSFDPLDPSAVDVPRMWLLNLERLFEGACRQIFRELCPPGFSVVSGSERAPTIFHGGTSKYRANPDFVFENASGIVVGDAKYKEWTGDAKSQDLYQLLVHASAFGATRCFLLLPAGSFQAIKLGRSQTGAETWIFGADIRDLRGSLRRILEILGVLPATGLTTVPLAEASA